MSRSPTLTRLRTRASRSARLAARLSQPPCALLFPSPPLCLSRCPHSICPISSFLVLVLATRRKRVGAEARLIISPVSSFLVLVLATRKRVGAEAGHGERRRAHEDGGARLNEVVGGLHVDVLQELERFDDEDHDHDLPQLHLQVVDRGGLQPRGALVQRLCKAELVLGEDCGRTQTRGECIAGEWIRAQWEGTGTCVRTVGGYKRRDREEEEMDSAYARGWVHVASVGIRRHLVEEGVERCVGQLSSRAAQRGGFALREHTLCIAPGMRGQSCSSRGGKSS
jgi:hypothetical protein